MMLSITMPSLVEEFNIERIGSAMAPVMIGLIAEYQSDLD